MARIKIFVGGIHGSGKGFLCEQLSSRLLGIHVSASKLLHWTEKTKLVDEVSSNQRALTKLIKDNISGDYNYLIDEYFALCNEQSKCESVPLTTFETIGLNAIVVITCNPDTVRERLQVRDGESYLSRDLIELQELEKKMRYIYPQN